MSVIYDLYDNVFKFRVGDTDEKGGCTFIGGSWVDKTTDDLFKFPFFITTLFKLLKLFL